MYLISGTLTLTQSTSDIILCPDDVVIINPNSIHSSLSEDPNTTAYILQISYDFLKKCQDDPDKNIICFDVPLNSQKIITPAQKLELDKLKDCLILIQQAYLHPEEYFQIKLYRIIYEIIYIIFMNFSTTSQDTKLQSKQFKHFKRLSVVTTYIKENYSELLTLSDMAALIHVTPSYLSRFFKKTLGISFLEYTTLVRLEHAYTDILTTDYPIMYISEINGFANYSLFIKKFKEKYNLTPLKLRNTQRIL